MNTNQLCRHVACKLAVTLVAPLAPASASPTPSPPLTYFAMPALTTPPAARYERNDLTPYNPAYGLPDSLRIRAMAYADTHGVPAAAAAFSVAENTIYRWKKAYREAQEAGQ